MSRVILACETLKRELNILMEEMNCRDPVIWLEAGAHNQPRKRREAIAQALGSCSQYDTVLLAMSFCGNALMGLDSGEHTLFLPCFDDCIGLLLEESRQADTYYLTEGWLEGQRNILAEYRNALKKYGKQKTNRIFSAMLRGYQYLAWLNTGFPGCDGSKQAKEAAQLLGLTFIEAKATLSHLKALLGEQESTHILRIPPHTAITLDMRHGMLPVTIANTEKTIYALPGENLLQLLRRNGLAPDAPCGGNGTCGKCTVMVNGTQTRACQIAVQSPLTVEIPRREVLRILTPNRRCSSADGPISAAVDIGTTSVVCTLIHNSGEILGIKAVSNPQGPYGADVVSRIRSALSGEEETITHLIRDCVNSLLNSFCQETGLSPASIQTLCIVGNPAMQQLFLGISPRNLSEIPFRPVLTNSSAQICGSLLPICSRAKLLTVPDISGYVGADTVACILAEGLLDSAEATLLVDIGTNGEMVLSNNGRMLSCATAAGPALEGAGITCGMTASPGAIDHVWVADQVLRFSTIENAPAAGICGSGLIDAVAALLELGIVNQRGRMQTEAEENGHRIFYLTENVFLTQEDIRQVQLAKGAIRAGIELMVKSMGISLSDISRCLLAGAFGTYLNPESACRIGLLPPELKGKIQSVGNAALTGAIEIAANPGLLGTADRIVRETESLELASMQEFPKAFARAMRF